MASILGDIKTPFVNDLTLKRVMSSAVKKNIFQNIFTKPGEAVTEEFSEDTSAAQIQVIRVKPINDDARRIGGAVNGGYFNEDNAAISSTQAYPINMLEQIDRPIDIPTNAQDMINVNLVEAELANLSGRVARNINAMTIAVQIAKNFNDLRKGLVENNWIKLDAENPNFKDAIIDAGAQLDEGNEAEGIDAYPDDGRAVFIRSKVKSTLLKTGQLIVGGSNTAQDMIRKGGLDASATPEVATSGYIGEVNNMPVYVASKPVWRLAEKWLGLAEGALDGVEALVVSGIGTGRGLAFNHAIKIVDTQNGQGKRIQPCYRFGAECWDALSVVPIVKSDFTNPSADADLEAIPPKSRTPVATE
ncbi:MAG: hypothetical protein K2K85_03715 [Clostridia bacterium]|nr:hypothetical protein [Clostridia bacterium]